MSDPRLVTPSGVPLAVMQIWAERDGRFNRLVEVRGWRWADEEHTAISRVTIRSGNKITTAKFSRFNGKSGGYVFVKDPYEAGDAKEI